MSVLGDPLEPLPPVEIKTKGEVFDFKAVGKPSRMHMLSGVRPSVCRRVGS